jgi:hypothetical protein
MSDEWPLHYRIGGWLFMVALGPIHFTGEMVGPAGGTSLKQWAAALLGTVLWGVAIIELSGLPSVSSGAFQEAAAQTTTQCYYFCGPWYTWMVTWIVGIVVLSVVATWVYSLATPPRD